MSTTNVAVPGTVIPSGSLTSPAGGQGIQGIQGIQGPQGIPWQGFVSKTAAYTLTTADSAKYIICSGGSWTLTLPAPALGLAFQVRNDMGITGTTGTITIQPNGGTIDGQASIALLPQQECTLITDGTNWRTRGLKREVILGTQDFTTAQASAVVLLPSGYRYFELNITGLLPTTTGDYFLGQLSLDGGNTWLTSNYYYGVLYNNSATATAFTNAENSSNIIIAPGQGSNAQQGANIFLKIFAGSGSRNPSWLLDSGARNNTPYQARYAGYGFYNGLGPATAFKYYALTTTLAQSFLTMKGVV